MSTLIDTHTHIYLPEFDQDMIDMMVRAKAAGVASMLLPAIDSSTHEKMLEVAKKHGCLPMMGLHPCSVTADYAAEIAIIKQYLHAQPFVAIGEIGLDFYWDKTFVQQQYEAFHAQIGLAMIHKLPISIHSRNATNECIEVVRQYPGLKGVFHCFSGNATQAMAVMDTGFYLGVGGVATFKNSGLDKAIGEVGLSKVLLETDAPYLAPVPFRGKRNEPAYLANVVQKLAEIAHLTPEQVAATTTENARELFNV
jgi:TatD DNase family protein